MPLLYEPHSFSPDRIKDAELQLPIFLAAPPYVCPIDGQEFPDEASYIEHMKTKHPLQWYFWYAPYGKPLLAFTSVSVAGLLVIIFSKAFPPPKR